MKLNNGGASNEAPTMGVLQSKSRYTIWKQESIKEMLENIPLEGCPSVSELGLELSHFWLNFAIFVMLHYQFILLMLYVCSICVEIVMNCLLKLN